MKPSSKIFLLALSLGVASVSFAQKTATPSPAASATASQPAAPKAVEKADVKAKAKDAAPTTSGMPAVAAAGGGAGKVWVNSKSKTYHCEGSKFYGKTKVGEYMTEADAKTKGNHADHGKACAAK